MNPIMAFSVKIFACIIIAFLIAAVKFTVGLVEKDDVLITKILGWGVAPTMLGIAIYWLLRSVVFAPLA